MFLKNKNIIFKIRRSKVTDYAALNDYLIRKPTIISFLHQGILFKTTNIHYGMPVLFMRGPRGWDRGSGPLLPPPPENSQSIESLINTGPDSLKTQRYQAVNIQCWAIIDRSAKRHLYGISLAGRWWPANSVFYWSSLPSSTKRKKKKTLSKLVPLWKNFPGSTHAVLSPPVKYFYWPFQGGTSFVDHLNVLSMSCVCHAFASVNFCLVVTCWERADLLALVCDVLLCFCHFPMMYPG